MAPDCTVLWRARQVELTTALVPAPHRGLPDSIARCKTALQEVWALASTMPAGSLSAESACAATAALCGRFMAGRYRASAAAASHTARSAFIQRKEVFMLVSCAGSMAFLVCSMASTENATSSVLMSRYLLRWQPQTDTPLVPSHSLGYWQAQIS